MSTHAYTEDQLVEQPAIGLFAELGWTTVSAIVAPSFCLIYGLHLRIQNLRRTRDLLLPRLLSGQIPLDAIKP